MKNTLTALAFAGALGLLAGCGGGSGEETGSAPAVDHAPAATAADAAGAAAADVRTVKFQIDGMT